MLSAEHGKDSVLGRSNLWLCLACQPWLISHDGQLVRREIVHYQQEQLDIVPMECQKFLIDLGIFTARVFLSSDMGDYTEK
jgi:hypothetical protein